MFSVKECILVVFPEYPFVLSDHYVMLFQCLESFFVAGNIFQVMMVSNRDSSSWNGSLSPKEFSVAAFAFAEKWGKFNSLLPHWSWVSPNRSWIAAHEVSVFTHDCITVLD